jgi:cell wall-associated NlpC family hydrolase
LLRKRLQALDPVIATTALLLTAAVIALVLALGAAPASADTGGLSTVDTSSKPGKAKLTRKGKAIAPANAPKRVVAAIEAANKIRKKPYKWGGGHAKWEDRGYDCSGAVSYALRGARMLKSPMDSSGLARWGSRGKGKWISVYANSGHVYAVIAGLRWDTSMTPGDGPGWSKQKRSSSGFKTRHYRNY